MYALSLSFGWGPSHVLLGGGLLNLECWQILKRFPRFIATKSEYRRIVPSAILMVWALCPHPILYQGRQRV
jgi:hypothetical protein